MAFSKRNISAELQFTELFRRVSHRGPDNSNLVCLESEGPKLHYAFGHHRLAILETSANSNQPLTNKNGSILVYNGEIYNLDIIRKLIVDTRGVDLNSDSQVLLTLLEEYGLDILKQINGMFAFAFKHYSTDQIWLGRDRLGIKPLYYSIENGQLWFSSEAKPLGEILNRKLDQIAIHEWIRYQIQISDRTFFENVRTVKPGSFMVFTQTGFREVKYWSIDNHLPSNLYSSPKSSTELEENFKELFQEAVKSHLISDVPISSIISGGMDSSSVASLAAQQGVIDSFTGRYSVEGFDESEYAKQVALKCNSNLSILDIKELNFSESIEEVISSTDLPAAGPGAIGQFLVSKKIRDSGFKVVLSGTGGDELFLGYTRNRFPLIASSLMHQTHESENSHWNSISGNLGSLAGYSSMYKKFVAAGGFANPLDGFLSTIQRNFGQSVWSPDKDLIKMVDTDLASAISPNGGNSIKDIHDTLLRFELGFFLPSILQVEDRTSMANGIETRVPFLDLNLLEFMLELPLEVRLLNGRPKELLRKAMQDILPPEVLSRKDKMGFPVPIRKWARGLATHRIDSAIHLLEDHDLDFIDSRVYRDGIAGIQDERTIWALITIAFWFKSLNYLGGES